MNMDDALVDYPFDLLRPPTAILLASLYGDERRPLPVSP
jgi:hypothetical protein